MKMFNLFKNKEKVVEPVLPKPVMYTVNNKNYAIEDSFPIKIQSQAGDVSVYGYTLEVRWKDQKGEWYSWMTYWNHRIYISRSSALDAAIKVFPSYRDGYEWRITPIYKMTEPEYRDYKIDQLLSETKVNREPNVYEIKAWKVKDDCEIFYENTKHTYKYSKGTLFIQVENGNIVTIKDQRSVVGYGSRHQLFNELIKDEKVEQVDIQNEKWAHPHLCKELKTKIKNKN
jgi:hypothetical protein